MYTGTLKDGKKFDSTFDRKGVFSFDLRRGGTHAYQVIKGMHEGVLGMKEGGKRLLIIPPELGYGARGFGIAGIPPNAGLYYEVELLKVR
jgi:FKBP-type peptidyl-prolyl cis-trans isomerase